MCHCSVLTGGGVAVEVLGHAASQSLLLLRTHSGDRVAVLVLGALAVVGIAAHFDRTA